MNQINIFLVDNDHLSVNLYRAHLNNQGYTDIRSFTTGFDCMNNLFLNPDVIFLGSNLGYDLSLELLRRIKSYNADIDVILLPGPGQEESLTYQSKRIHSFVKKYDYVLDYITCVLDRLSVVKKYYRQSA